MLLAAAAGAYGTECPAELDTLVPDAEVRAQLLGEGLQLPLSASTGPALVPALDSPTLVSDWLGAIPVTYGAEVLRLIRDPGTGCRWTDLYNHLRAVSTLQGIEYYSSSRGRHRTLYRQSHAIAGPDDHRRVPDPVVTRVPESATLYLVQEDSTFGNNVYQTDYRFDSTTITMQARNLTTMWWGILPLVNPDDFRSVVTITPTDQGLLYYAAAGIHTIDIGGVRERAQRSLRTRLDALERWLSGRLRSGAR